MSDHSGEQGSQPRSRSLQVQYALGVAGGAALGFTTAYYGRGRNRLAIHQLTEVSRKRRIQV